MYSAVIFFWRWGLTQSLDTELQLQPSSIFFFFLRQALPKSLSYPGCAWTAPPPASAYQRTMITGVCHWTWPEQPLKCVGKPSSLKQHLQLVTLDLHNSCYYLTPRQTQAWAHINSKANCEIDTPTINYINNIDFLLWYCHSIFVLWEGGEKNLFLPESSFFEWISSFIYLISCVQYMGAAIAPAVPFVLLFSHCWEK